MKVKDWRKEMREREREKEEKEKERKRCEDNVQSLQEEKSPLTYIFVQNLDYCNLNKWNEISL